MARGMAPRPSGCCSMSPSPPSGSTTSCSVSTSSTAPGGRAYEKGGSGSADGGGGAAGWAGGAGMRSSWTAWPPSSPARCSGASCPRRAAVLSDQELAATRACQTTERRGPAGSRTCPGYARIFQFADRPWHLTEGQDPLPALQQRREPAHGEPVHNGCRPSRRASGSRPATATRAAKGRLPCERPVS